MTTASVSFKSKISSSFKFLALDYGSSVALRLISTVVLSRLLAPDVYGVFAIVLVYMYVLQMFSDIGLRSLILTREGEVSDQFLRTCWTASILRGVVILLLSVLIGVTFMVVQMKGGFAEDSPYAATELPYAIAALGAATFIYGFESPHRFMNERRMAFGRVSAMDISRNIITLAVTIALAFYLRSVWALVLGQMVRSITHVTLSFLAFAGPRLALCLDRQSVKVLIDRGKWILSQSALTVVSQSFDRIFLGFVMSSTTFGFYYIARQLVDLVPQFLYALNGSVILQVFNKLHDSTLEQFRRNYYRYRLVVDGIAGLVAGGLFVLSPLLVEIIFDDRYAGVAPIMQVLSLAMLLIGATVLNHAFNAQRRFHVVTKLTFVSASSLVVGLVYATLVAESVNLALYVVALHRLPEALLVTVLGQREGWVIVWREGLVAVIFGIGTLMGWGVLSLWSFL